MVGYSAKAQPFLDAIAEAFFESVEIRDWIIEGTPAYQSYLGATALVEEQRTLRWRKKRTKQPFWANYWCGRDKACECRGTGTGIESDAIFFVRNESSQTLAVHVEFKHPKEKFGLGQQEAYARRAACFRDTYTSRPTVNAHSDWVTVIFCDELAALSASKHFQRVITHSQARKLIPNYPT